MSPGLREFELLRECKSGVRHVRHELQTRLPLEPASIQNTFFRLTAKDILDHFIPIEGLWLSEQTQGCESPVYAIQT